MKDQLIHEAIKFGRENDWPTDRSIFPDLRDGFIAGAQWALSQQPQPLKKYPIGGYAPGNYQCKCVDCKQIFVGDKRAVQCEPCAIKMADPFKSLEECKEEVARSIHHKDWNEFKKCYEKNRVFGLVEVAMSEASELYAKQFAQQSHESITIDHLKERIKSLTPSASMDREAVRGFELFRSEILKQLK